MNTRPLGHRWLALAAATLPMGLAASGAPAAPAGKQSVLSAVPSKPTGKGGGIAGFGGGGGSPCEYALDDGIGENNLGFGAAAFQGSASGFSSTGTCPKVNVIRVAWGTMTSSGVPVVVSLYADPDGDGDPTDITAADLLAQSVGYTANEGSDVFNNYPIAETTVPPVFFVAAIALSAGSAAGDFPMRLDTTTDAGASYFIAGITDPLDPIGSAGTLGTTGGFGFAGNVMVHAAFDTGGDECEDCFNVAEGVYPGSTTHQTGSTGDDTSCSAGDTIDSWYCYTASCDGIATASLCDGTGFDTTLAVFDACGGGEIACDDDGCGGVGVPSSLSWPVTFGVTYSVRVSGWNGDSGDYVLTLDCEGSLLNDDCADRIEIFDGLTDFSTLEATTDGPDNPLDTCNDFGSTPTGNDIWFNYTAICDGTLLVTTCEDLGGSADYDTDIVVYSGTECPAINDDLVGCNDDDPDNVCGNDFRSTVRIPVVAGETFKIRVGGWGLADAGTGQLLVDCQPPNDLCADALPISDGVTPFDTTGAGTDGPENPADACNDFGSTQTANDIWYDYLATCTGELLVTTCVDLGGSAGYDTDLAVYADAECPVTNDRLLGCNDDDPVNPCGTGTPFASTVRVPVIAGESYKIRVGGWGATDSGPGELLVECQGDCRNRLNLRPATPVNPLGYDAGDEVVVVLEMLEPCTPAAGYQAFISFDESELAFTGGVYTASPFGQPVIDPIVAADGAIDLAAGLDLTIGQTPTEQPALLAELHFLAVGEFCLPESLGFRASAPPTRLSGPSGDDLLPLDLTTELAGSCEGDANLDGQVDTDDLMAVVQDYGNDEPCGSDTDGNGVVNVDDIILVILRWGACP